MDKPLRKRMGASAALVLLSPALIGALSGCNNNCDSDRSTLKTSDDCGTGGRSGGGYFGGGFRGGGGQIAGQSAPRSGGFGAFGRMFSGGG